MTIRIEVSLNLKFKGLFSKNLQMSKLPHIGTTIFSVMSKMAVDYNAINLSQGFPNFPVDPLLIDCYQNALTKDVHQYAPMPGNPALLTQISALISKQYQRDCNIATELLVTAGATQGIYTIIQSLIYSGDEVVILDPCYDCYDPSIILAGGIPVHVSLNEDYLPDWDKIDAAITPKTKLLIINNPHNPSGRVWESKEFEALKHLMTKHEQLYLLSDEVYEYISFETKHISLNTIPSLHDRTIIVSSFGKTFHITGWKMGYLVAPENLMHEIKKVHQYIVFSVNSVAQVALSEYLSKMDVNELGTFYAKKRDLFRKLLASSKFKLLPCEGSYFQLADYSAISKETDVQFAERLVKEFGVAAIPVSVFNKNGYDQHHIRFCFAKTDETLIQATEKLCKI